MKKVIFIFVLGAAVALADTPLPLAVRNARVVTVSGPTIERGTVVVRNGLIEAVGSDVTIPADAWVIEGEGLTVYPGLTDALSSWGIPETTSPSSTTSAGIGGARSPAAVPALAASFPTSPPSRGPEDRPSTTSWLRAADLVRSSDRRFESARSAGFTTAITFPMRGIFAGQGAIIDLAGERQSQMVIAAPVGQYLTLASSGFGGGFPGSLMGVIAYVRQIYLDADHYKMAKASYEKSPRGTSRPGYDRALEGVLESPRILLPATREVEIDRMLRFAKELKQKAILYGGHEGYLAAGLLKKSGVPVLVSLKWPEKARDSDPEEVDSLRTLELRDKAPSTPAVFAKNGVPFAFYSDSINRPQDLSKAVKRAIDAGLSQQDAVRAMTLSPAEIYGVADRLGSIEKGKIANLVITKGDLFQDKTEVKHIIIDGRKFEPLPEERPEPGTGNRPPETRTPSPESEEKGR